MFSGIIGELEQKTGQDLGRSRCVALLERVMARDLLLNFRDLAMHSGGHLKPGRLYRSSTLSRYSGSHELRTLLDSIGLSRIIDLRMDDEVQSKPYSEADLVGIQHSRLPINIPPGGHPDGYFGQLMANPDSVVTAMDVIADATSPVLIHCHVGKDRTGWMCALLGMLAGVPDHQIIRDYMASHSDVLRDRIQGFIHSIREAGGASTLLCSLGSTPETLNRVVNCLAMRDTHTREAANR
jgi:protein tyrosine/serine phosphatase